MNLTKLIEIYASHGCKKIYAKSMSTNDNSKNQVYLGGTFDILNIFPFRAATADQSGEWSKTRFKTILDFYWLSDEGKTFVAPNSQLILYPKYPEVRFSGFLRGCKSAPSTLMASRIEGRILFFGIDLNGKVLGYVASPRSEVVTEFNETKYNEEHGVFIVIPVRFDYSEIASKSILIKQLTRIHKLGWINSKMLKRDVGIVPCNASNCGGYTLEAELGITPNGYSEPDYLGWEIKQFGVNTFNRLNSSIITLMTPEPTGGYYKDEGVNAFIHKYGYDDKLGRPDRKNFGGIHKCGVKHPTTNLTLHLLGFNRKKGKIMDASGSISLISDTGEVAASWSFSSLLLHWSRKHAHASFVPSLKQNVPIRQYCFGDKILMGTGTRFDLYLQQMSIGNVYYDPGIKMENVSSIKPKVKRRSQFRVKSKFLSGLYDKHEILNLLDE